MYFWVFNMTVMSLTLWHHFWSRLIFFLVNTLYLPTLNKLTCLYFCQIVLTRIQIDRLHMQLRKARKTCVLSCSQSIFLSKTNSHMVCGHRSIFTLQICCLYGTRRDFASSLLVGWCSGNFYTDLFALHVLSVLCSPRLVKIMMGKTWSIWSVCKTLLFFNSFFLERLKYNDIHHLLVDLKYPQELLYCCSYTVKSDSQ